MKSFDVIIIGAGPGGYVSAIRAAQLGMKTALVEKSRMGGMCLNWGCVPSRRLMESARFYGRIRNASAFGIEGIEADKLRFDWKRAVTEKDRIVTKLVKGVEFLLKKYKVEVITGEASLIGGTEVRVGGETYGAGKTILATGSRPDRAPVEMLPEKLVVEIDDLYSRGDIPQKIIVAGGDTVACEMASMLRLIGKDVVMVAPEEKLLPWLDNSLSSFVADKFKRDGIQVFTASRFSGVEGKQVRVGDSLLDADIVVNCSRRKAVLPVMQDVPLDLDQGFAAVNEYLQTSVPSVYAIGDVTGRIFAHVASAQGMCAVNHIAGLKEPVDYLRMPITIYMDPEISAVGMTEEEIKTAGIDFVKGEFPMAVNSKALVEGTAEGFVKVLAEQKYGEILGVHAVAARATDLISEAVMCMRTEGTLDDLTRVVHPHPTVSETFLEAGFKASGRPLHM
ncbi:dihydrolipoyl dehydrogenase [candidate division KSB1 bacterium]|nr:MAG: dihydrolipoyl dehydrogenase [candidate division KSB1 bacterium]